VPVRLEPWRMGSGAEVRGPRGVCRRVIGGAAPLPSGSVFLSVECLTNGFRTLNVPACPDASPL
jgi:hypothetical protein